MVLMTWKIVSVLEEHVAGVIAGCIILCMWTKIRFCGQVKVG
jgi:hypothetical protein